MNSRVLLIVLFSLTITHAKWQKEDGEKPDADYYKDDKEDGGKYDGGQDGDAPVSPPYAANTVILGHKVWGKHADDDPTGVEMPSPSHNPKPPQNPPRVLRTGRYHIQNLYGCDGEPTTTFPSGGSWQCHKAWVQFSVAALFPYASWVLCASSPPFTVYYSPSTSYVGKADTYMALYSDRKPVWNVVRIESMDGKPTYIIRTDCAKREYECHYWYDNPDDDGDWLTLADYRDTLWHVIPRRNGFRVSAAHRCRDCKKNLSWKGAGVEWKYLYAGDDEGVDFDFLLVED